MWDCIQELWVMLVQLLSGCTNPQITRNLGNNFHYNYLCVYIYIYYPSVIFNVSLYIIFHFSYSFFYPVNDPAARLIKDYLILPRLILWRGIVTASCATMGAYWWSKLRTRLKAYVVQERAPESREEGPLSWFGIKTGEDTNNSEILRDTRTCVYTLSVEFKEINCLRLLHLFDHVQKESHTRRKDVPH